MNDQELHLCNLVARGTPMAEARKIAGLDPVKPAKKSAVPAGVRGEVPPESDAGDTAPAGAPVVPGEKPAWMPDTP